MSYQGLVARMGEIHNLEQAAAVLNWDQRTYMPAKASDARAKQLATLAKFSHELFVARETQDLLAAAEGEVSKLAADSKERATVRVVRRALDKQTRVPTALVVEMTETASHAEDVWQVAR